MSITSVGQQQVYTSYSRKTEEVNESRTKRVDNDNEAGERGASAAVTQAPSTQTVDPCKGCSGKGSRLDAFL